MLKLVRGRKQRRDRRPEERGKLLSIGDRWLRRQLRWGVRRVCAVTSSRRDMVTELLVSSRTQIDLRSRLHLRARTGDDLSSLLLTSVRLVDAVVGLTRRVGYRSTVLVLVEGDGDGR